MAAKTNLSFTEINAEFASPIFSYSNGDVTLSLFALTGTPYTSLDDQKALQAVKGIIDGAKKAQDTANANLDPGELLDTFNNPVLVMNELAQTIEIRMSQDFTVDITQANVYGQNI